MKFNFRVVLFLCFYGPFIIYTDILIAAVVLKKQKNDVNNLIVYYRIDVVHVLLHKKTRWAKNSSGLWLLWGYLILKTPPSPPSDVRLNTSAAMHLKRQNDVCTLCTTAHSHTINTFEDPCWHNAFLPNHQNYMCKNSYLCSELFSQVAFFAPSGEDPSNWWRFIHFF